MQNDKKIKLAVDATCVKHGKWLRLLGFDTEIIKGSIAFEKIRGRILITRNKKLKRKFKNNILFLPEMPFWDALNFIIQMLSLEESLNPFTRCSLCNEEVVSISKEKVKGKVPHYVYETHDIFYTCPKCNKIYWQGSHYEKFLEDIRKKIKIDI
uniref:Mut7-C RNAse domain-containing protein n=1 Tax=candidate division WOR-3 bacterium TaxID=2052148 RepID=A0A7V3ZTX9_UNCW3